MSLSQMVAKPFDAGRDPNAVAVVLVAAFAEVWNLGQAEEWVLHRMPVVLQCPIENIGNEEITNRMTIRQQPRLRGLPCPALSCLLATLFPNRVRMSSSFSTTPPLLLSHFTECYRCALFAKQTTRTLAW